MHTLTIVYGEKVETAQVQPGILVGEAIAVLGFPIEQPCAGRGTCGKCKVLAEAGLAQPDALEQQHLTPGELALNVRLACRARIQADARVVLSPSVVYSNKIFKSSHRYKFRRDVPLGLAIDLGSTTVAAFLTMLDNGEVCTAAASLNQQSVYGADVISRMAVARKSAADARRLQRLALASINQAVDALHLSVSVRQRIERVTIVCNPAMHHLLLGLPLDSLSVMPFQPYTREPVLDATSLLDGIFPASTRVSLPPLIGGFVGSDALACLAYFNFDRIDAPVAVIDLGTNGEVLVTNGKTILAASTAAGPAFEGVNISCGMRAVDGAVTRASLVGSSLALETIGGEAPLGLTGSGLLSAVHQFRLAGVIEASGRISPELSRWVHARESPHKGREIWLSEDGHLSLTQWDVRELQKAKGAIRAALDILLQRLKISPSNLQRLILTGSFGGQVDIESALALGMIPPVRESVITCVPNGAGLGAASFLSDKGFLRAISLAVRAQQIDLDRDAEFSHHFAAALGLSP